VDEAQLLDIALKMAVALALGAFIGLERQFARKDIGVRTFALVALLAVLLAQLWPPWFALVGAAFVMLQFTVIALADVRAGRSAPMTTGVSLLTCYALGLLVAEGLMVVGVIAAVIVTAVLFGKRQVAHLVMELSTPELSALVKLGIVALVVYPILPEGAVDPWGVVQPRLVWLMVVLVAAISFANYFLVRRFGASSLRYAGFFGGLANSTATVAALAGRVREDARLGPLCASGAVLADSAMCLRNLVLAGLFAPPVLGALGPALASMAAVGALYSRLLPSRRVRKLELQSPLPLSQALAFGLFFLGVVVASAAAYRYLGDAGFLVTAGLAGVASSAGAVAGGVVLFSAGEITAQVLSWGVFLATVTSVLVKLAFAATTRGWGFKLRYAGGAALVVATGAAVLYLTLRTLAP